MMHNKEEVFKKEENRITEILHQGINNFIKDKKALFNIKERVLKCMDERTPGGIHLAGAGILLGIEKAVEFVKKAKITKVTWHRDCGAVALSLKNEVKNPSAEEINDRAKEFTEELASKAGINSSEEEMQGETAYHCARAIYYDNTGEFNINNEVPTGFVISRKYLDKEYAQEELKIAASIAFGSHCFGDLFSVDQPLLVVAVSELGQIDSIDLEIEEALMNLSEYKEGRIKLDQIIK